MSFKFPRWAANAIVSAVQVALLSESPASSTWRRSHGRGPRTAREKSRALARIASEQGIKPIRDFDKLALDDPDQVRSKSSIRSYGPLVEADERMDNALLIDTRISFTNLPGLRRYTVRGCGMP